MLLSEGAIAQAFDARDEWAILTTIGRDGFPHSVPLGYWRTDDRLYFGTPAASQKVRNIERERRVSVLVTPHKSSGDWSGILVQGEATIVRGDESRLRAEREARRQRGELERDLPSAPRPGEVIIEVRPYKVIDWSY